MNFNHVIDLMPYFKLISLDEKQAMFNFAKKLANNMFDRQGEFSIRQDFQKNLNNRIFKIYTGLVSENVFHKWISSNPFFQNANIEIDGSFNSLNSKADRFDFKINGKTIDIKSSVERNSSSFANQEEFVQFCLDKRNFTLPTDQKSKDIIIQIMYNFDFVNGKRELKNIICFGGIEKEFLCVNNNIRDLKLNNGNLQSTFMTPLKNGKRIEDFFKTYNISHNLLLEETFIANDYNSFNNGFKP